MSRNSFFDSIIRNKDRFTNTFWNQIFITEGNYFKNGIIISIVHVINLFSLTRVMFWRDKYWSNHREGNTGATVTRKKRERAAREVKVHLCFSSSFDAAIIIFSPISLPPFSCILGKTKLLIGLISILLLLRE